MKLRIEKTLKYDLDRVWDLLSDFDNYYWNRGVKEIEKLGPDAYRVLSQGDNSIDVEVEELVERGRILVNIDHKFAQARVLVKFSDKGGRTGLVLLARVKAKKFFVAPLIRSSLKGAERILMADMNKELARRAEI